MRPDGTPEKPGFFAHLWAKKCAKLINLTKKVSAVALSGSSLDFFFHLRNYTIWFTIRVAKR
jgi:hypothetical protein